MSATTLTERQAALLAAVAREPGRSTGHYARAVGLAVPTVSLASYRLVDAGLITVAPDAHDRRRTKIAPTAAGVLLVNGLAQEAA
jgi:DNA-binding MarR family transcriptional regulator